MIESTERRTSSAAGSDKVSTPARSGKRALLVYITENITSALRALFQNGLRSVLTILGIVIGVMSIVTLVAILQGVKAEIRHQVEGLGANLVLIVPSKLDDNGQMNPAAMIGISPLTLKDVDALSKVEGVEKISPIFIVSGNIDRAKNDPADTRTPADKQPANAFVVATNKAGVQMNPTSLAQGRYFEDTDGNVCILGYKPYHELFGDAPALGKTVLVQNIEWKVVGILAKPKNDGSVGSAMLALDTLVYLPASTVHKQIPGGQINRIALQTDYKHPADKLNATLTKTLLATHNGREEFGVITQEKGLALVIKLLNMAQSLLVLIAGISLFVAGVGIMNIMLVTVTERTREIGVRKTVGARRSDILLQFLTESVVLSIFGGAIGLALSWVFCILIARYSPLTPIITPGVIVMALAVCFFVGILFGVTPAIRASRLNPIDALRHE